MSAASSPPPADDRPITDEDDEFYTGCTDTCADDCQADHRGEQ